ncbi:ead/Ea22-like family protein [Cronobacter sakazakii]|nr:ead/Ea22-like family protein [Cronobacter sakazakii]ELY6387782.1 ead/Ea22-like family protein [Cronobacter sakazakii]
MNTAKLKAAAEKATPGPWRRAATVFNGITCGPFSLTNEKVLANVAEKANAEFIAAVNPAAVLELIAATEAAQKRIAELEEQKAKWVSWAEQASGEVDKARQRIAELEVREVKPVAWMRSANVTSFMSRFTTDEKYAAAQWGDEAVALYSLPPVIVPACFTDERNLKHINERGRETSLIWGKQNSEPGDVELFRIARSINLETGGEA